jgi:hypothetical protein
MEVSVLISAISFFAYNLFLPMGGEQKQDGLGRMKPSVNQYLESDRDYSGYAVKPNVYGTLTVSPHQIRTYCGSDHWEQVNQRLMVH